MGAMTNSPFIAFHSMDDGPPGGTVTFAAGILNPDPHGYDEFFLFAYLSFGPSHFIQDPDTALTMVDTRFPSYFQSISVASDSIAIAKLK
jgi:hypothetical protein